MQIQILPSQKDMANAVAALIISRIEGFGPTKAKPFVLCSPTGSTPIPVYSALIKAYESGVISFEHVVTFNLDEYVGLAKGHPQSYATFMHQQFFSKVNIPKSQIHMPPNNTSESAIAEYEALIADSGGIHLLVAGLGENGHLAFNEPGSASDSRTRVVQLTEETRLVNARFFDSLDEVPLHAVTLGLGTIMDAREIIVMASGSKKANALTQVVQGEVNEDVPASVIRRHSAAWVFADEAAASGLDLGRGYVGNDDIRHHPPGHNVSNSREADDAHLETVTFT